MVQRLAKAMQQLEAAGLIRVGPKTRAAKSFGSPPVPATKGGAISCRFFGVSACAHASPPCFRFVRKAHSVDSLRKPTPSPANIRT